MAPSRKPDFFVIGASRSGTTSLYHYLVQHPSIQVPVKEPSFFSDFRPPIYDSMESYLDIFAGCPPGARVGDMSTAYLPSRNAARRIREFQPQARILMVLRSPIDRAYSMYWYKVRSFQEHLTFEEAIAAEETRIREGWVFGFQYATSGLYAEQVLRYLDVFGRDRVRIHLFEDLKSSPGPLCLGVFRFLEVKDYSIHEVQVVNRSGPPRNRFLGRVLSQPFPGRRRLRRLFPEKMRRLRDQVLEGNLDRPPSMSPDTRAALAERFRDDVERLQGILGRDLNHWLAAPGWRQ